VSNPQRLLVGRDVAHDDAGLDAGIAGAGWLAVGDAAMAMDSLSSMGILGALRAGAAAAGVIARHLSGDRDALASHARNVARDFDGYLANRQLTYAQETRWGDHPFWRRRQVLGHAVIARSTETMGTYRSGWLSTSLVWLACVGMAAAAIGLVVSAVKP
jgi:flavin-dependent dehydrogenase